MENVGEVAAETVMCGSFVVLLWHSCDGGGRKFSRSLCGEEESMSGMDEELDEKSWM